MDTISNSKNFNDFLHAMGDMSAPAPAPLDSPPEADYWERRARPLSTRLKALLTSIPDTAKAEGLSVTALSKQMIGRYSGKAAPREVAVELRALGYTMRRVWRNRSTEGVRTLWFAPAASST